METYRSPYWESDPFLVDVCGALNFIKCSHNHKLSKGQDDDANDGILAYKNSKTQAWQVCDVSDRLTEYDDMIKSLIEWTCLNLKSAYLQRGKGKKKPKVCLGNKYEDSEQPKKPIGGPKLWVIVDKAEHRLMPFLKHHPSVLTAVLPVGDIWFVLENYGFVYAMERKTWFDLWNSTQTGHKKSQLARILNFHFHPHLFAWLMEKPNQSLFQCEECQTKRKRLQEADPEQFFLQACISNLIHRDGQTIRESQSMLHSIYLILRDLQALQENGVAHISGAKYDSDDDVPSFTQGNIQGHVDAMEAWYLETNVDVHATPASEHAERVRNIVATCKGGSKPKHYQANSTNVWGAQLKCIKGITADTAADITDHYPTWRSLSDAYRAKELAFLEQENKQEANAEDQDKDEDDAQEKKEKESDEEQERPQKKKKKRHIVLESDEEDNKTRKKKQKKRQKLDETNDRILALAWMLKNISKSVSSSTSSKSPTLGAALSARIWIDTYATTADQETWLNHPKNKPEQDRKRKLTKMAGACE